MLTHQLNIWGPRLNFAAQHQLDRQVNLTSSFSDQFYISNQFYTWKMRHFCRSFLHGRTIFYLLQVVWNLCWSYKQIRTCRTKWGMIRFGCEWRTPNTNSMPIGKINNIPKIVTIPMTIVEYPTNSAPFSTWTFPQQQCQRLSSGPKIIFYPIIWGERFA